MKFDPSQTALDGLQFQQAREIAAKHDRLGVGESVGSQFEQVLLHKVVEAMRKTIPESGLLTSESGNQMYDHLIAQAMSQAMAKAGGVGLGQKLNAHMGVGDPQMGLEELQGSMKMDMRMQRQLQHFLKPPTQTEHTAPSVVQTNAPAATGVDLAETLPPVEDRWLDSPQAEQILRDLLGGAQ
jgi:Rod binding domain-containing protein